MLHEIRSMEMFSNELKGVFRLSFHHIIQNTYTVPNAYRTVQEVNRIVQETNELYRTRSIPFLLGKIQHCTRSSQVLWSLHLEF